MRFVVLTIMFLALMQSSPASAEDAALARTQGLIDAFKAVKQAPEGGKLSPRELAENVKAFEKLDGFFAFQVFTGETARPHRSKFSDQQYPEYQKTFREVIRIVAYPDSGDFFREARYKLLPAVKKGDRFDVKMEAVLEKEDYETDVTFHWRQVDGTLQIVDVSFEGASLVKDYSNQFGRIIKKEGVGGLLKRMNDRLEAEIKKQDFKP